MGLLSIFDQGWAVMPEKLIEIGDIYRRSLKNDLLTLQEEGSRSPWDGSKYKIAKGTAIIFVEGLLMKSAPVWMRVFFDVIDPNEIRDIFKEALEDPQAKSIILHIDSPGGSVDGVQEVANLIFDSRGKKPIVAFTDGMMGSAAYWIGSAAEKIFISSDTTQVGSIGVVASHLDISKAEEKLGYKTTEIVAGKYKRIASRHAPLNEEGRATLQGAVDYIYSVFVNDVAKFRGVSVERALGMADGKVFIGRQAQQAGLVDDRFTLDGVIDELNGVTRMARVARDVRMAIEKRIQAIKGEKPPGFNDKGRSPQKTFAELVHEQTEKGVGLKESILKVAKENPEAYQRRLWGTEHLNP